jgi:basic amino acid/polyamine antiporter, APA family
MAELKRSLGAAEGIFFGVGSILGAGIYALVGKVAGYSGNMMWLSFLVASLTALCTAFSYAELSAALPKAGGEFEYTTRAFGKKLGVFLGSIISVDGIVTSATVSLGFAGYFRELTGLNMMVGSLGIISLLFLINVSGIRESSVLNIICTIIEFTGLVLVIIVGYKYFGSVDYMEMPAGGWSSIFNASALAFFAYTGFEDIVKLAEETKNPEKNIPRALFVSGIIVTVVYVLVAISVVSVVPIEQLKNSPGPLADVVKLGFGNTGIIAISVIALFSTSNTILSNMIGSSRVMLDMGRETNSLRRLSYVSKKRRTPVASLVLIFVFTSAFALIGDIEVVARIATLFIFVTFVVVNLAVIRLRITHKDLPRPFRIPFNIGNIPVISVLGILLILLLFLNNMYSLSQL